MNRSCWERMDPKLYHRIVPVLPYISTKINLEEEETLTGNTCTATDARRVRIKR